jgi:hypothetical protein
MYDSKELRRREQDRRPEIRTLPNRSTAAMPDTGLR